MRLKVYTGSHWHWCHYPIKNSHYFQQRLTDPEWEKQSPKLVVRKSSAELHFSQIKEVKAKKIVESKADPDLVTVGVDLHVKMLAVTRSPSGKEERFGKTVFARDQGLDQCAIPPSQTDCQEAMALRQAGERGAQQPQLWRHVRRMNEDVAHNVARRIANVCAKYPGCGAPVFERLRKITVELREASRVA